MSNFNSEFFIQKAINEADLSVKNGSLPFAAIITDENQNIVWKDHDRVKELYDPTAHAEVNAIRGLCKKLGVTKLYGYSIYTTSEPCLTCLSACIKAGIKNIYFGAKIEDDASLVIDSQEIAKKSKKYPIEITGGILEKECLEQRNKHL